VHAAGTAGNRHHLAAPWRARWRTRHAGGAAEGADPRAAGPCLARSAPVPAGPSRVSARRVRRPKL